MAICGVRRAGTIIMTTIGGGVTMTDGASAAGAILMMAGTGIARATGTDTDMMAPALEATEGMAGRRVPAASQAIRRGPGLHLEGRGRCPGPRAGRPATSLGSNLRPRNRKRRPNPRPHLQGAAEAAQSRSGARLRTGRSLSANRPVAPGPVRA